MKYRKMAAVKESSTMSNIAPHTGHRIVDCTSKLRQTKDPRWTETQSVSTQQSSFDETVDGCSSIHVLDSDEESQSIDWLIELFNPKSSMKDWEIDWDTDSETDSENV